MLAAAGHARVAAPPLTGDAPDPRHAVGRSPEGEPLRPGDRAQRGGGSAAGRLTGHDPAIVRTDAINGCRTCVIVATNARNRCGNSVIVATNARRRWRASRAR